MSTATGQHEVIGVIEPGWYDDPHGTGDRAGLLPAVRNTPAVVGLVISLLAIPVGVLLGIWFTSLIGALVSGRGLSRARALEAEGHGPVGRSQAVWGAALGMGFYALRLVLRILAS